MIDISRALEGVRTWLCNGVHTTTDEVGLTNIVGRDHHLQLLDSIDRDGVTTTRQVRTQTEVVVEVGTINSEVGGTTISTSKSHSVTSIRRKARHISNTTRNSWQACYLRTGDVCWCTCLFCSKLRCLTCNEHLTQFIGILRKPDLQIISFTKFQLNTLEGFLLKTNISYSNCIRTTGTHTLNPKASIHIRNGGIARSWRLMDSLNSSSNDRLTVGIADGHHSAQTWSSYLRYDRCRNHQHHSNQKEQSFLHKQKH